MPNTNFVCPYCGRHTTITSPNEFIEWINIELENSSELGNVGLNIHAITCPNAECNKLFFEVALTNQNFRFSESLSDIKKGWQLLPESEAKVLPDYVPQAIQDDYYDACRIRDLSPKASATLARRCLQGMIRDFHKISKARLIDEIRELEGKIDQEVWDAIDAVRSVGNIGAHMEKDIDIIIDVDPGEAQALITLIESLVDEWYVHRFNRKEQMARVKQIAIAKEINKQP